MESETSTYRLEDTTDRAFKVFMQWLYFQKLVLIGLGDDWKYDEGIFNSENDSLVELWVLGDKLEMPRLQNTALKAIHELAEKFNRIASTVSDYMEDHTSPESSIQRYSIASCATLSVEGFETERRNHFPDAPGIWGIHAQESPRTREEES